MKSKPALLTLCLAALALPAAADTFILKDGTKLEGRIISEEGDDYLLEVQVTASIKDERTVPKAEVEEIVAEKLDEKAFAGLPDLVPTPDLLTAAEYERRTRLVSKFLADHPKSPHAKEAAEILATLETEAAAVEAGGVKLGGKIIAASEYQGDAYDIDASVLAAKVREHIAKSEWLPALRAFEELSVDFQSSAAFAELLPVVRQVIERHQAQVTLTLDGFEARAAERKAGLERMSGSNRTTTEQALAEEAAVIESRFQEEKKNKQKWITPHPAHKASLQESAKTAQQELRRIDGIRPPATPINPGEIYRNAWSTIHNPEAETSQVNAALSSARNARLPGRYLVLLEDAAKAEAARKAEVEAPAAPAAEAP
jgi:hypothetical protein